MWAVLPVKDLASAKQRLRGVLTPDERQGLARAMLRDVLAALCGVADLGGIVVVTRDPVVADLAGARGARIMSEAESSGQSAAVGAAAARLDAEGASGLIAVPGDVPLIGAADVARVLAAHAAAPAVTLVPARDRRGTNALVASPPHVVPFGFGPDSFVRHQAAARAAGITPAVVTVPGLALDIDDPADLHALIAAGARGHTGRYLADSGIAGRLAVAAGERGAAHVAARSA